MASRVLDFGCGSGWLLAEANRLSNCFEVGVDVSIDSLHLGSHYPGFRHVCADGLALPFADGSFDVVIGHVSMPYMNTRVGLREIARVLVPGGSLLLTFHSFSYVRERLRNSLKAGNWKDVLFSIYMGTNGLLNHLGLPQLQTWWKRSTFETVNTPKGAARSAHEQGFTLISTEHTPDRIFFVLTARKPNAPGRPVLPVPGWSAYCPLSTSGLADYSADLKQNS